MIIPVIIPEKTASSPLIWSELPHPKVSFYATYCRIDKYLREGFVLTCMLVRRIHRLGLFPQKDADQETDEDSYPPDPNFRLAFCHLAHSVRRDFKTLCRSQVWAIWLVVQCTSIVTNNTVLHSTFIFVFALRCTIGMDVQVISRVIKTDHCRSFPLSPSNTSTTIGVIVITAIVIISTKHHHWCHCHGHHPTLPPPSLSSSSQRLSS